ncbi:MAG: GlcG/HbpS family heme-binding protein [Xanthobacteraceae bacterium]
MTMRRLLVAALLTLVAYSPGNAQTAAPAYGAPIDLALAKRVMAAAEAEALRNNWAVAIAVIDTTGDLVMLQRLDNTNLSSTRIARGKALTALEFRRPTKALEEAIAAGGPGLRLLAIEHVTPIEGGLPLIVDGKIIGAIGVSGGAAYQDAQIGKAGADAIK